MFRRRDKKAPQDSDENNTNAEEGITEHTSGQGSEHSNEAGDRSAADPASAQSTETESAEQPRRRGFFGFGRRTKPKETDEKVTAAPPSDPETPGLTPAANALGVDDQAVPEGSGDTTPDQAAAPELTDTGEVVDSEARVITDTNSYNAPDNTPDETLEETPDDAEIADEESQDSGGLFGRFSAGLKRTRSNFATGLGNLLLGKKVIDEDALEELETALLLADVGVEATTQIMDNLSGRVRRQELDDADALFDALSDELEALLTSCSRNFEVGRQRPYVLLFVGVNGVGKTTTIGKLALQLKRQGHSVVLAAGDTFRAAAVEQLQEWGRRADVPVIAQDQGSDSASVIFDALQSAKARGADVVLADTAGRLQSKSHLMDELTKVHRVIGKFDESAPQEVILVLDAATGQNALSQAREFQQATGVTGLVLTKLDGTAKGGVVFAVAQATQLPILFIGMGEKIEDLRPFEPRTFVKALLDREDFQ